MTVNGIILAGLLLGTDDLRCLPGQEPFEAVRQELEFRGATWIEAVDPAGIIAKLNEMPPKTDWRPPERIGAFISKGDTMLIVFVDRGCIILKAPLPKGSYGLGVPGIVL